MGGAATVNILCAANHAVSSVDLELLSSDFGTLSKSAVFRQRYAPLSLATVELTRDVLVLSGKSLSGKTTLALRMHIGFPDLVKWGALEAHGWEFSDRELFADTAISLLQLRSGTKEGVWNIPMAQLPPCRVIETRSSTAHQVFRCLYTSDVYTSQLERLVLEDVPMKTGGTEVSPGERELLPARERSKWMAERETYSDLQGVLRRRQESGSPVKLIIRSGNYDADVIEGTATGFARVRGRIELPDLRS